MSKVKVIFLLGFRELVQEKEVAVEARSLSELIERLARKFGPRFREIVLEDGELSRATVVFVNGRRVIGDPSRVSLESGDVVVFSTAYGGGGGSC